MNSPNSSLLGKMVCFGKVEKKVEKMDGCYWGVMKRGNLLLVSGKNGNSNSKQFQKLPFQSFHLTYCKGVSEE